MSATAARRSVRHQLAVSGEDAGRLGEAGQHDDERRDESVDDEFEARQSDEVRPATGRRRRHVRHGGDRAFASVRRELLIVCDSATTRLSSGLTSISSTGSGGGGGSASHCKYIHISADILWRVFDISLYVSIRKSTE